MSRTAKAWHRRARTAKICGRARGLGVAWVASAAFAASLGFNFGVANQVTYLPSALRLLDPELLARDWFVTETTQYHPVFAYVGALLLAIDRAGWGVALGLSATVTFGCLALFELTKALAGRAALPSFFLLMVFAFVSRLQGPAVTYVFDGALQPSTLSSAFFLAATAAFVAGRLGVAGVLLGVSGLCHLNLLVLLVPAFALASAALGSEGRVRRLATLLGPSVLACVLLAPSLLCASAGGAEADFARHVFVAVRLPHHHVLTSVRPFVPLLAWLLAALGVALGRRECRERPALVRCLAVLGGLTAVIALGTLAGIASERLAIAFAWRLVPHLELLLAAFVISVVLGALLERLAPRPRGLVSVAAGVLLASYATGPVRRIPLHSNLLAGSGTDLGALETWLRERSPKAALFLTPPDLDSLRLRGERAIVVDWKANPAVPSEILAWYRRLTDVTGRREIRSSAELRGYDELDEQRLRVLRARYGFDFVVVRQAAAARLPRQGRVYENASYVVLEAALSDAEPALPAGER